MSDALTHIRQILSAKTTQEVFSTEGYKKEYIALLKIIHPDICPLPEAQAAVQRLNEFKNEIEKSLQIEDDAGTLTFVDDFTILIKGEKSILQQSLNNYNVLMNRHDTASNHFKKYLPASMFFQNDDLVVRSHVKIKSLHNKTLPSHHVTWITSRIFEFASWLHQIGYAHIGINPESVAVAPDTHGIVFISFYHLKPLNTSLKTLSGRYQSWYPPIVFNDKKAIPYIDLSLIQRTAIYLLGDTSGNGIKLKKTQNEALIDFLIQPHFESFETYDAFRQLLLKEFGKPQFFHLNL